MKLFNKYLLILLVSIPFFSGCASDDGYSLDKFWVEVASVVPLEGGGYYIKLDNGKKLWPATSVTGSPTAYTRAQVNYTILSDTEGSYDHYVKVNYLSSVLTKSIIPFNEENNETLGDDKIKILELWEGDDYLNIHFGVNVGGGGVLHSINMVDLGKDADGVINLEFRHNANGDVANYGAKGLVAFDLRPYKETATETTIKFRITLNAFSGSDSEYIFKYNYTGAEDRSYHSEVEVSTDDLKFK